MPECFRTVADLKTALAPCAKVDGRVAVTARDAFRSKVVDDLVRTAVFSEDAATRDAARWVIRAASADLGAHAASIQGLYDAIAAGRGGAFTVPAHNLRGLVYDQARAIFRAAAEQGVGAFIFEISRSEMDYGSVRPAEFSACVLGAAIREGWKGPVFIQGDHVQFTAQEYFSDPPRVTEEIQALAREEIDAGFLNIDIDPSTLVVLERPTVKEQQRDNYERSAEMTEFIRGLQPAGVEISVGGEIGEVGKRNSTVEEFEAYFEGYRERWTGKPISKMSVQTGTSHGGVVLPDGSRAEVQIDFTVLKDITAACRKQGLAGTVQHGASTLPESMLAQFPLHDAVEIHLATEFQRTVFDHAAFPVELRQRMARWIEETRPPEWRESQTPAQNFERCAKRCWGAFKRELWDLPPDTLRAVLSTLETRFKRNFAWLNVRQTRGLVDRYVKPVPVIPPQPAGL